MVDREARFYEFAQEPIRFNLSSRIAKTSDKLSYIGLGGELLGLLAFNSWSGKDLGAFN